MKGTSSSSSIPSKMRETVQNLKDIVSYTDQEIYSMLRECNMDPTETVNRLLNQDTFHEVKSKHEKKKETKASGESRSQRVSSTSGHGVMVHPDHAGRSVPQINFNDWEATCAKHAQVRENGAIIGHTSPPFGSGGTTNNSSALTTATSRYNGDVGSTVHFPALTDGVSLPSQPSSTLQNKWLGVPGQLSMADVVKMGMSQRKTSKGEVHKAVLDLSVVPNTSEGTVSARCISTTAISSEPTQKTYCLHDIVFKVTEGNNEPSIVVGQHEPLEEWIIVDHSTKENYNEPSPSTSLHIDEIDSHLSPRVKDIRKAVCVSCTSISAGSTISDGHIKFDGSEHSSFSDDGSFTNISCVHSTKENYHEPSASTSLHIDEIHLHLSPHVEDIRKLGCVSGKSISTESTISDGSECSSFSDDGSVTNISCDQQDEAEDVHEELLSATANLHLLSLHKEEQVEASAVIIPSHLQDAHADCSHLSFGSFGLGVSASKSNLEVTSVMENAPSIDYSDTGNLACYNTEQLRTTPDNSDLPITSTTCRYSDVVSASQPELRRDDTPISEEKLQFNVPSVSSIASLITVQPSDVDYTCKHAHAGLQVQNFAQQTSLPPVTVKSGPHLNFQSIPQPTSSTAISSVPTLTSNNLRVPAYSQPILPLGPMLNMFTYPHLPQSNAYMQSQASLQSAGMKRTVSENRSSMPSPVSGLPKSFPVGSGYGGYRSSTNSSRTSLQNPLNVAAGMPVGYEEALRSQYKEGIPLQQQPHPESTSLNLLAGNAQPLREPELPSLHFGANPFVSTKYIPAVPSFTGTTISFPQPPHPEPTSLNLLAGNAQPLREPELPSLHFGANQFVPTKYIPAGTTISFPQPVTVKSGRHLNFQSIPQPPQSGRHLNFHSIPQPPQSGRHLNFQSIPQPLQSGRHLNFQYIPQPPQSGRHLNFQSIPQPPSSTAIPSVPALTSNNLRVPAYSQPILPLGPMPNMFTYPHLPQSITYMQSQDSLQSAGMKYTVPENRSSMPAPVKYASLPKPLPVGSGYGGYGSSTNSSRTSLQNPLNVAAGMPVGYEEALRSQYKEGIPHQQDGNISMLLQPATFLDRMGIPKPPAVPTPSLYGIQEQGHQGSNILGQAQNPPQMGMAEFASLCHTQQLGGTFHEPSSSSQPLKEI